MRGTLDAAGNVRAEGESGFNAAITLTGQAAGDGLRGNFKVVLVCSGDWELHRKPAAEARDGPRDAESDAWTQAFDQGRYLEALQIAEAALREAERLKRGPETVTDRLGWIAATQRALGRTEEAESAARRALAMAEKALDSDHPGLAPLLSSLAAILQDRARYADAEALLKRALDLVQRKLGPSHLETAASMNNLAALHDNQGRFEDAEKLFRQALAIYEKSSKPDDPDLATCLANLGVVLVNRGRYSDAEPILRRALDLRRRDRLTSDLPVSLLNLADLLRRQGRDLEAEPLYVEALSLQERLHGRDHRDVAEIINNLALLHLGRGRIDEAAALGSRAVAINERVYGPHHPALAVSLNNLAGVLAERGENVRAEALYRRALEINTAAFGPENRDVAAGYNNLAALARRNGRFDVAEDLYRRSLAINERRLGKEHPDVANGLSNLALLFMERGDLREAEGLLLRALSVREAAFGKDHPSVAANLDRLSVLNSRTGRLEQAIDLSRRVSTIARRRLAVIDDRASVSQFEARRGVRDWLTNHLEVAAALREKYPERNAALAAETLVVGQLAETSSAGAALERIAARFTAGSDTLGIMVRQRQDLIDRRREIARMILAPSATTSKQPGSEQPPDLRRELQRIDEQLDQIDGSLDREFPQFAALSNPKPVELGELQRLLREDEVLLAYIVDAKATFLWAVRRNAVVFTRIGKSRTIIDAAIATLRRSIDPTGTISIDQLRPFDTAIAHSLYIDLLKPAAALLEGARSLLLVPDGSLTGLPFATLLTESADTVRAPGDYRRLPWLARQYAVTILPSISSLRVLRQSVRRIGGSEPFVGFGDPALTGARNPERSQVAALLSRGVVADVAQVRQLEPLPESAEELLQMAASLGSDRRNVYLRARATERIVKTLNLSRYRVLAFATHGLMAGEFLGFGEPALVLTPPDLGDAIDDGLLSASEIAQLRLNADWVILSACNTAASDGTPGAEGLSGLARAFFYAGSRALLVSHWPVFSEAAVRLTTGALSLAARGTVGRAEALRRTMMVYLDDTGIADALTHPAVWAPFTVVGEAN